ncbi:MAG: hypothetical protein CMJ64_08270 [Planctomycetaceae bacterium]|nr:hypothetical protein [Planctomycetaceae bacterium]
MKIRRRYYLSLQEVIREINPILRGRHNYFKVGTTAWTTGHPGRTQKNDQYCKRMARLRTI